MPKGSPTMQTIASEKYQKKVGIVAKSYKLKKEVADNFKEACQKNGEAQSVVITRMMMEYIENNK